MEFIDGRDLRALMRKAREYRLPMPEPLAAVVIMQVAAALDYAHRKRAVDDQELQLVHRDISPQNILISYGGAVKLADFGIAKAANQSTHTQAGALKGKLLYMSPEQALGEPLDHRSDLYSLGLVLAELLTGERCFQADSELGVLEKVRMGKVVDVRAANPALSKAMGSILDRLLVKDVDRRYGSARQLERDLKTLLARQGKEPSGADLADYVNALLKGTRGELEHWLATRFTASVPPAEAPAASRTTPGPGAGQDEEATLAGVGPRREVLRAARPAPVLPPAAVLPAGSRTGARRWILVLGVLVLMGGLGALIAWRLWGG
jgi:serine/threonine protein kinase